MCSLAGILQHNGARRCDAGTAVGYTGAIRRPGRQNLFVLVEPPEVLAPSTAVWPLRAAIRPRPRRVHMSARSCPPAAERTTTSQGGHLQKARSAKAASASPTSPGPRTALVQTGL